MRPFSRRLWLSAAALLWGMVPAARAYDVLHGIGVMGDSASDEYQFYHQDPLDRHFARNWVEILAATTDLNFGTFTAADRGAPRWQGYEYNWARTRSTAAATFNLPDGADFQPLTTLNQHLGLASQVAAGQVSLSAMLIGNNDFLQYFVDPTQPPPTAESLNAQVQAMATQALTAAGTVLAADPTGQSKMILFTIPDEKWSPAAVQATQAAVAAGYATPEQVATLFAGLSLATNGYNQALIDFAALHSDRVAIADLHGLLDMLEAQVHNAGTLNIAGVDMNLDVPGHELSNFWLDDGIHPGTLAQAMIANLFLDTLNARTDWGAFVPPLTGSAISDYAQQYVPEPATLSLLAAPLGLLLLRRRR